MSQQIIPIVSIVSGVSGADDEMSDLQFLTIKEFEGKVRSDDGFLSANGDLATLTANTGKDMYLARAQCSFLINNGSTSFAEDQIVVLKIDGVVIETARVTLGSTGLLPNNPIYEFKNIGRKVLAGEIIKLEVTNSSGQVDNQGFIECFEEDTGTSPQIPPLNPV